MARHRRSGKKFLIDLLKITLIIFAIVLALYPLPKLPFIFEESFLLKEIVKTIVILGKLGIAIWLMVLAIKLRSIS
ncbi:hypothetical protein GF386_02830 [Candidatus Pacearchaeota archaeon]|nr:hypothetical protein [Candidatus Pacearchaeota archaeon]MBD3283083.1 hypothetical protein [Candidatus Pacearchaeota archaeon]